MGLKHFVEDNEYDIAWCGTGPRRRGDARAEVVYDVQEVTCVDCLRAVMSKADEAYWRIRELEGVRGEI